MSGVCCKLQAALGRPGLRYAQHPVQHGASPALQHRHRKNLSDAPRALAGRLRTREPEGRSATRFTSSWSCERFRVVTESIMDGFDAQGVQATLLQRLQESRAGMATDTSHPATSSSQSLLSGTLASVDSLAFMNLSTAATNSSHRGNEYPSSDNASGTKCTPSMPLALKSELPNPTVFLPASSNPPLPRDAPFLYSDRFIPSRLASEAFSLAAVGGGSRATLDSLSQPHPATVPPGGHAGSGVVVAAGESGADTPSVGLRGREDAAAAYALLLRNELLVGQSTSTCTQAVRSASRADSVIVSLADRAGQEAAGTQLPGIDPVDQSASREQQAQGSVAHLSQGSPFYQRFPSRKMGESPQASAYAALGRQCTSHRRNLFRFMHEASDASSCSPAALLQSPLSLAPVGEDTALTQSAVGVRRPPRKIARSPFKVLDAPALQDDFYLNLVDWSSSNLLAVGLGSCVYLWSAVTSKVTKLCDVGPSDSISAVSWTQRGTLLSLGTGHGKVQVWDVVRGRCVRVMAGHRLRCGTLSWAAHLLSTGSRDRSILHRDIRSPADYVARLSGHKSEVCGLKWSPDERELASGGNDNQLLVWNLSSTHPVLRFQQHQAAVKALAWSPHQHGLLASGGGTADRCIRFWNTTSGSPLSWVETGSQVCNLLWSRNTNELASTHGYSHNQVVVWKYPSMSKLATLSGHTMRVLFLAVSPDGQTIVTGAGDETLRFWSVFPPAKSESCRPRNKLTLEHVGIR